MAIRRVTSRSREAESSLGILLVPGQAGVPTPRLTVEEILGMESVPEQKKSVDWIDWPWPDSIHEEFSVTIGPKSDRLIASAYLTLFSITYLIIPRKATDALPQITALLVRRLCDPSNRTFLTSLKIGNITYSNCTVHP